MKDSKKFELELLKMTWWLLMDGYVGSNSKGINMKVNHNDLKGLSRKHKIQIKLLVGG
jgi:hypothetical protein